jgi:hypothetical protein
LPKNLEIGVGQGLIVSTERPTTIGRRGIVAPTKGAEHVVVTTVGNLRLEPRHYFILGATLVLYDAIRIGNRRSILAKRPAGGFNWGHFHIFTSAECSIQIISIALGDRIPNRNLIELGASCVIQNHLVRLRDVGVRTAEWSTDAFGRGVAASTKQSIVLNLPSIALNLIRIVQIFGFDHRTEPSI